MTVERNLLPGGPTAKLIASVRTLLRLKGICPPKGSRLWVATWEWAASIARREDAAMVGFISRAKIKRLRWPRANEIATQYLMLVVAEMNNEQDLRLHRRAMDCVTPFVAERLSLLGKQPDEQRLLIGFSGE